MLTSVDSMATVVDPRIRRSLNRSEACAMAAPLRYESEVFRIGKTLRIKYSYYLT